MEGLRHNVRFQRRRMLKSEFCIVMIWKLYTSCRGRFDVYGTRIHYQISCPIYNSI